MFNPLKNMGFFKTWNVHIVMLILMCVLGQVQERKVTAFSDVFLWQVDKGSIDLTNLVTLTQIRVI